MQVGVMKFGACCDFIHLVYSKPQSPAIINPFHAGVASMPFYSQRLLKRATLDTGQ